MKNHPEFYAWLFLLGCYAFLIGFVTLAYHRKAIYRWASEWCALLSEIYHGTGQRWQDHG